MALDRDTVVRTALALLDEVGLDGLTLRRIAKELDVQAPALYWHFQHKQALLDEMATTVLREHLAGNPLDLGRQWPEWVSDYGVSLRQMLLSRRDGARMFSGTHLTDDSLLFAQEAPLGALVKAGFTPADAARSLSTVYHYAIGFVIEQQAVGPVDVEKRPARLDTAKYPLTVAAGEAMFGDFDGNYEHGLGLIVAGMRTLPKPKHRPR